VGKGLWISSLLIEITIKFEEFRGIPVDLLMKIR
jgi:hypothetical protein